MQETTKVVFKPKTKKKKPTVLMRVPLNWYERIKEEAWEKRMKMTDLLSVLLGEAHSYKMPKRRYNHGKDESGNLRAGFLS